MTGDGDQDGRSTQQRRIAATVGVDVARRHIFLCCDQTHPKCCDKAASLEAWAESGPRNLELLIRAEQHADASAGPDLGRGEQAFRQSTRLLRHAVLASHRGDTAEARRLAGRALEVNPDDGSARFFLTQGAGRRRPGPGR